MPLVRIDTQSYDSKKLLAISDATHQALHETFGFPLNDLFQIVNSHDGDKSFLRVGNYLDVPRDEGIVYIHIFLREGHPDSVKQRFYQRATELLEEKAAVKPHNVFIVLTGNGSSDWSLGYGKSQYLP